MVEVCGIPAVPVKGRWRKPPVYYSISSYSQVIFPMG
jgi:hypothetical protein